MNTIGSQLLSLAESSAGMSTDALLARLDELSATEPERWAFKKMLVALAARDNAAAEALELAKRCTRRVVHS